nr:MAG TPA: hypothetical protein [Caudoviricetes sp.]
MKSPMQVQGLLPSCHSRQSFLMRMMPATGQ